MFLMVLLEGIMKWFMGKIRGDPKPKNYTIGFFSLGKKLNKVSQNEEAELFAAAGETCNRLSSYQSVTAASCFSDLQVKCGGKMHSIHPKHGVQTEMQTLTSYSHTLM